MTRENSRRGPPTIDLRGHHALCELNFHKFLNLLPGIRGGVDSWSFSAGNEHSLFKVKIDVVDDAPYTTTVVVEQSHALLQSPRIVVRLYHDVSMAEIVSWDHHRYWLPTYAYPNTQMYHPDEKLALNQFLGEWLRFFLREGQREFKTVTQIT